MICYFQYYHKTKFNYSRFTMVHWEGWRFILNYHYHLKRRSGFLNEDFIGLNVPVVIILLSADKDLEDKIYYT